MRFCAIDGSRFSRRFAMMALDIIVAVFIATRVFVKMLAIPKSIT